MIKRYSDVSRSHSIIIDGFNPHTNSVVLLEKVVFMPLYRIFRRDLSDNRIYGECFTMDPVEANNYWSQLCAEKEYLF